ncbi:16S rRNA (adenine(1518)-N(6)/adenine(1519)-N(6))-dimethyltransferaseRsmA [soil metagenome]
MSESEPQPQPFPNIADMLRRKGIWLEKRKSQHFLKHQRVCMEIAALGAATRDDLVIEVGAGLGNLTVELAAHAGRVVSVELDRAFEDWHQYLTASYPGLEFLYDDFLKVDVEALVAEKRGGGRVLGVGNLPYQITSDILFRFVDSPLTFDRLVFMVQREVAERIAAGASKRESGALTYKIALRYKAHIAMSVKAEEFLPPPKVDSAVLVLDPLPRALFDSPAHRKQVYLLLDRIFNYRRKTLVNCLMLGQLVQHREAANSALDQAAISRERRPETLSLEEVLALAAALRDQDTAHA